MEKKALTKRSVTISAIILIAAVLISLLAYCVAAFVFLSPSCYKNNPQLTEQENYFIKKLILETVENEYSVFSETAQYKNLFVWIDTSFMNTAQQLNENLYSFTIQTYYLDEFEDSNIYVQVSTDDGYHIVEWGIDP